MKKKINKVIALGICMIMLFSAGVFAEESAVIVSENKESSPNVIVQDEGTDKEPQKAEAKASEVKEDIKQTVVEIAPEVSLEKPEEKLIEEPEKLIVSEIPEVEVQEEAIEAKAVPILMRGPAGPLKALYPVRVLGKTKDGYKDESVICGERAGITGVYGKETVNRYDRNQELKVTVYREGYLGNMLSVDIYATNGATVTGGTPYNYVLGPDGGATSWYTDYTIENIDKDASKIEFIITGKYMYPSGGIATFTRTVVINLTDSRKNAPENVEFLYDRTLRDDAYELWGANEEIEYKKIDENTWTSCSNAQKTYFEIPAENQIYLVRYKASGDIPESQSKQLVLRKRPSAPSISLNYRTEVISNLKLDMEYCLNESDKFIPVTEDMVTKGVSNLIDDIPFGKYCVLKIRKMAGEMPVSEVKELKLYSRAQYPQSIEFIPEKYTFSKIPANMLYSMDGVRWITLQSGTYSLERYASENSEVAVYFKVANSENSYSESKSHKYILPKLSEMNQNLKIDYYNETITGISSNAKYQYASVPKSNSWQDMTVSGGAIQIKSLINSVNRDLYIREIKPGQTPSVETKITLPKRPTQPLELNFVYDDINNYGKPTLKNVNTDIEYKVSNGSKWENAKDRMFFNLPQNNTNYIFRAKAKADSFASFERTMMVYANENCSSGTYDNINEDIKNLNKSLEFRIDNGNYEPYKQENSNMNVSNIIDNIPNKKTVKIYIRKITTTTKPNSNDNIITLYSRLPIPTTPYFDKNKKMLSGVNEQMQYRKVGEKNWRGIYSTTVNVSSLIGNTADTKLEVRMMANSSNSGSKPKIVNCY